MVGLNFARTYLDDLLCLTKGNLDDHLDKLCVILDWLKAASLKCNAENSLFCQTQIEYLGYWITCDGIKPLPEKFMLF